MRFSKKLVIIGIVVTITGLSGFVVFKRSGYHASDIIGREAALQFRHLVISLSHFSDIIFLPYYFAPSRLPEYQLTMTFKEINTLDDAIGDWDPDVLTPLPGDRKVKTKAQFTADNVTYDVHIRYRGDSPLHWAYFKKSWLIEFDKKNLFHGMQRLELTVPETEYFYTGLLNQYRAKKLGILHEDPILVRLVVDGYDSGVYIASEDSTDEWAEKKSLLGNVLSFNGDGLDTSTSIWSDQNIERWESDTLKTTYSSDAIAALQQILTRADDKSFALLAPRLIDLDAFYRWNIIEVLTRTHQENDDPPSNNIKLFLDNTSGKFTIVPHHMGIREAGISVDTYEKETPLLIEARILGIPDFLKERNRLLQTYLEQETADDLKYYDSLTSGNRREFLSDFAKTSTSLGYLAEVGRVRGAIEQNSQAAKSELHRAYPSFKGGVPTRELSFARSFSRLSEVIDSPERFIARNPDFIYDAATSRFLLPAGSHVFHQSVVVPAGVRLVLEPGAQLFFGEGVSLISYSPVEAIGLAENPILITALNPEKPWGSFVVVGTGDAENIFRHVTVSYGSVMNDLNGVSATGMFAFPHSRVRIEYSRIEHSRGEDALNPKYTTVAVRDSVFFDTLSDAFDCDSCHGVIERNTFREVGTGVNMHKGYGNTGGDALDISFTDALIRDNVIIGATDKGISVGEMSKLTIERNIIMKNNIGIAVKDLSDVMLSGNIIVNNQNGIELYKKKDIFGPGHAALKQSILWGNAHDIFVAKDGSALEYGENNQIQSQGGVKPDFAKLLPYALFSELGLSK